MSSLPFDLDALELLTTLATSGSIGKAAGQLRITQPAASQRLRALERRVGLQLVERSPSGSTLTAAGAAVVDWSRAVLDAAEQMQRGIAALRERGRQPVRVAASLTVADHLVPRWLVSWHAARPDLRIALQVVNSEAVAQLVRSERVALGFVEGASVPADVRRRAVGGDELVVVVAPDHPWSRRRRPLTAAELAASPLILREAGSGTREALEQALAARGQVATPALELGSTTAIKAAVMAGEGPAVLSRLAVADEQADGRLVGVPVSDLALARRFHAIWHAGRAPAGDAASLLGVLMRGQSRASARSRGYSEATSAPSRNTTLAK